MKFCLFVCLFVFFLYFQFFFIFASLCHAIVSTNQRNSKNPPTRCVKPKNFEFSKWFNANTSKISCQNVSAGSHFLLELNIDLVRKKYVKINFEFQMLIKYQ